MVAVAEAKAVARANNGKSGRGKNKRDALPDYWHKDQPDIKFGEERFRVTAWRGERKIPEQRKVDIDQYVTAVTWEDAGPILQGTLTLTVQEREHQLALYEGHVITLESAARMGGPFKRVWEMRIDESSIDAATGTYSFQLVDEMAWLAKSKDYFSFRKSKKKKKSDAVKYRAKGWTADQIVRAVCKKYGVKVGKLAKGTKLITNLTEKNASPLDVIMKAYKLERNYSGRKFVVRMRRGKLQVVELRRSKTMLILGSTILEATIQRTMRKGFADAATIRATVGKEDKKSKKAKAKKGSKQEKLDIEVKATKAIKRYGYVHTNIALEDPAESKADGRKEAKQQLVKSMRPNRTVNFEHPGISSLFRGDAVKLRLPELGVNEIVYVTSVAHSIAAGEYTMQVAVKYEDPTVDKQGEEIQEKQCEKARKHNRTPPPFCGESSLRKTPKKNVVRGESIGG